MALLKLRLYLFAVTLVALLAAGASAQSGAEKQNPVPMATPVPKIGNIGTPEEEMLRSAAIRHEEEMHREMVERADEAERLGEEILDSYRRNNSLTREDLKRLERMEKLARKIRGSAGGSDDKEEMRDPPGKIAGALTRLAELSGALKKSVLKTSRLVISAAVIERSNELIELIQHIRSLRQP